MTKQKATLIGLIAIVLWSTMVGLMRGVSEGLGPAGGAAMIFSLSGLLLIFTVGFPNIRKIPVRYLIAGSVLFVTYEICLALALGYAATRHQAIEVGMVNYLWPSLTILFAILFNGQKTTWLVIPGLIIALTGVCWVLGGENGLNLDEIISNVASSPLSYFLAFLGAFIWATYCTVTNKYAKGFNVRICLCGVEYWHFAWQRDHHGRRILFYPCALFCTGCCVTQCTAFAIFLAGRTDGLRGFATLLAGNAPRLKKNRVLSQTNKTRLYFRQIGE